MSSREVKLIKFEYEKQLKDKDETIKQLTEALNKALVLING